MNLVEKHRVLITLYIKPKTLILNKIIEYLMSTKGFEESSKKAFYQDLSILISMPNYFLKNRAYFQVLNFWETEAKNQRLEFLKVEKTSQVCFPESY